MPRALLSDPLAPLCSFHGHDEEGMLEKLSCINACVHLRVCKGRVTSSEKCRPTMLELLGKEISSGISSVNGSGAPDALCRPHSLTLFSMSGCDPTVSRNSNITTALRRSHFSRALAVTKAVPRQSRRATVYHWFCWFFVLVSAKSPGWHKRDGCGMTGIFASPEAGRRAQNSRVGIRCKSISILPRVGKVFPCCLQSQQRK